MDTYPSFDSLWLAIAQMQSQTFHTAKGLEFTYAVRGGEIRVNRKQKTITKASAKIAYERALELGGIVSGPKKLGVFGASYLYPIFIRAGVIQPPEQTRTGPSAPETEK